MLTAEQMKVFRQANVSKDTEKTKIRVQQDFKAATNAKKNDIVKLSKQKRSAFYRVFKLGTVNARILLSLAQELNVSPFYYSGEIDEKEPFSESHLRDFLKENGYNELAAVVGEAPAPKVRRSRKKADKPAAAADCDCGCDGTHFDFIEAHAKRCNDGDEAFVYDADADAELVLENDTHVFEFVFPNSDKINGAIEDMTDDDAVVLMKALFMRAKAGGEAEELAGFVKRCLLI